VNAFVVSGLVKRRAELAGDIEKAHEALHRRAAHGERYCGASYSRRGRLIGTTSGSAALRVMRSCVAAQLRLQPDKGVVRSQRGPGRYMLWEITRQEAFNDLK